MPVTLSSPRLNQAGFEHGFSLRAAGDFARGEAHPAQLATDLSLCQQVHGAQVHELHEGALDADAVEADAVLSRVAGRAVGVRTADCVPLLIADRTQGHVVAVHAGWRGVAANITAAALRALGAPPSALEVAIGPCIGPCCFEVSDEVAQTLATASSDTCIIPTSTRPKVDLRAALEVQLRALGVGHSERVGGCTFCDAERYHSYRRDGERAGRMIAYVRARAPQRAR